MRLRAASRLLHITPVGDRSTIIDLDGHALLASGKFDLGHYPLRVFASDFEQ